MEEDLFEPISAYQNELKEKHATLTEKFFDNLVKDAEIDIEANRRTVGKRNKILKELENTNRYIGKYEKIRILAIVFSVLLAIAGVVCGLVFSKKNDLFFLCILLPLICLCGMVGLIVLICVKLNKVIRNGSTSADKLNSEAEQLKQEAWEQMYLLNVKFDWNNAVDLVFETVPLIRFDKVFDVEKLDYFNRNFNLAGEVDDTRSVYSVRTGSSNGNPFILVRYLTQSYIDQYYEGSLTVTWTERSKLGNFEGQDGYVEKSETLTASIYRPKPKYDFSTVLYYANNAAPDLCFSRSPVVPVNADEKEIQSIIKNAEKRLEKKAREAVKSGNRFNKLANSEFEALFGAENRNDEMQFRMMFTPLAQKNEVKLIRNGEYGDDFTFVKDGKKNQIQSFHGGQLDIDASPDKFIGFDYEEVRKKFVDFNKNFFRSVYFDFAPLLAIPMYTQEQAETSYGYCEKRSKVGEWELESLANYFKSDLLVAPNTAVGTIVKAKRLHQTEGGCSAEIVAHSFREDQRIEYVSVRCKNGNYYNVEVPWTEYSPLREVNDIDVEISDITLKEFIESGEGSDTKIFVNGLKATLL